MRLFTAIELPNEMRESISGIKDSFDPTCGKIKWVVPENIHVTLRFLGEVSDQKLPEIKSALSKARFASFRIKTSGLSAFPDESRPRTIWVGLKPHEGISDLHRMVDDALSGIGFERDRRFHPHITIGRVRSMSDRDAVSGWFRSASEKVAEAEFSVQEFVLKKSTLTPEGPVYEDVSVFRSCNQD